MSKIERFQGNMRAFASNAQGLERTVFGGTTQANDLTSQVTAAFLRGWGIVGPSEHPSLEDFNAAMYAMSQFIAYQHQTGVPEWHAEQEYYIGSVCTHDGVSYQSLEDGNTGNEPPSAQWTPLLTTVKLGEGSALPVGVPVSWPLATPPSGWLKCNGAAFTAAQYPKLALAYPALRLPDLRGEFIRGWDDGRGVDNGRALGSAQGFAIQNITGSMYARTAAGTSSSVIGYASGAFSLSIGTGSNLVDVSRNDTSSNSDVITLDASRVANTATETRPRNTAFNYIVRAA